LLQLDSLLLLIAIVGFFLLTPQASFLRLDVFSKRADDRRQFRCLRFLDFERRQTTALRWEQASASA